MYSTIEGAKKFAKNLKSLLDGSGILFPLNRCQTATVVAGGFRDWYDLSQSLKNSDRPVDPEIFRRRLVSALPQPCWMPVFLWMDEGHWPEENDDELNSQLLPRGRALRIFVLRHPSKQIRTSPARLRSGPAAAQVAGRFSIAGRPRRLQADPSTRARHPCARRLRRHGQSFRARCRVIHGSRKTSRPS